MSRTPDPRRQEDQVTLERALPVHAQWKRRLLEAARNQERLDVATIQKDDCCELGEWIHATGRTHYGHLPEFQTLLSKHRDFHVITGSVAQLINDSTPDIASAHLSSGSQFSFASMEVAMAITALQKAARYHG